MSTTRETKVDTIEYEFPVEELGWEMIFSVDYEVTPGEPEDRREIGCSLGTPASDPECVITDAFLIRINSDVLYTMSCFLFSTKTRRVVSELFGWWFVAWVDADEDSRVRLHQKCLKHAGMVP